MPGAWLSRGRRSPRTAAPVLAAVVLAALAMAAPAMAGRTASAAPATVARPAAPSVITLSQPVHDVDPLTNVNVGFRKDRLLKSVVPGTVRDTEDVRVALGPTGAPAAVTDRQRLVILGAGNYIVRELGPAREAVGLADTVPPVLELGTVVWQGFSPGTRALSALLTLDPGIEAARLPMRVSFSFSDAARHVAPLRPGAVAPAAGIVTVTLTNNTSSNRTFDTGTAARVPLARVLDRLRRAAAHPRAGVPPVAGEGLPKTVPGAAAGQVALDVVAPLRVTGTMTAPGGSAAITGQGIAPAAGGVRLTGTLSGSASFTVRVAKGDRIGMTLDVRPWLDPRLLAPPGRAANWAAWAASNPSPAELTRATQTMTAAAAATARAAEYSPYLQADTPGPDLSTFTYVVASPPRTQRADGGLQRRPGAITLAGIALLAVVGNAALLRRRL